MSQKKVDKYKEQKANREQIKKREKRMLLLEKCVAVVVAIVIVGWLGYSAYGKIQDSKSAEVTETVMDATAVNDYLAEIQSAE